MLTTKDTVTKELILHNTLETEHKQVRIIDNTADEGDCGRIKARIPLHLGEAFGLNSLYILLLNHNFCNTSVYFSERS